jgi:hypothetical protein
LTWRSAVVEFGPASPAQLDDLVAELRAADRAELEAAHGSSDIATIVRESVASTVEPLCATDEEGYVLAVFGVAPLGPLLTPVGAPWLLGTDRISRHGATLIRASRDYIAGMAQHFPVMVNFVDARNADSIKYLKAVGFTLDAAEPFGALGLPFHRFHKGTR